MPKVMNGALMDKFEELRSASFVVEPNGIESSISDVLIRQKLPAFIIGSGEKAHLRLDGSDIAAGYASVRLQNGDYVLHFLPAAGMVGKPGSIQPLSDGMTLTIGTYSLRFVLGEALPLADPFSADEVPVPMPVVAAPPAPVSITEQPPKIFLPTGQSGGSGSRRGLLLAALGFGLMVVLAAAGFALFPRGTTAPAEETINFAFNDGNVTIVMFDADW
jgi:hypothetical protein